MRGICKGQNVLGTLRGARIFLSSKKGAEIFWAPSAQFLNDISLKKCPCLWNSSSSGYYHMLTFIHCIDFVSATFLGYITNSESCKEVYDVLLKQALHEKSDGRDSVQVINFVISMWH